MKKKAQISFFGAHACLESITSGNESSEESLPMRTF